jgi:DNA modification methylase
LRTEHASWRTGEWEKNPRQLSKHDAEHLKKSLDGFGVADPLIINTDNRIIGGHMRRRVLLQNGAKPTDLVDVRVPSRPLTEREAEELGIRLNRNSGDWDFDALANGFEMDDLIEWGFSEKELTGFDFGSDDPDEDPGPQINKADELREKWGVEPGQLWQLGEHRLICGDCTDRAVVERLMEGEKADMMLTEPPYCSGGFQEAGKKSGSIGTRGSEMIANDVLSTRGYMALIKSVLNVSNPLVIYVFIDWRMWINLFDVVEACGFGVRNMIVWDKDSPGMGVGWRSQHELILCGMKVTQPFDPHQKAQGNVIRSKRTGNVNHPTEKPVEILETVIHVTDWATTIYDPFLGSGTTLIACERMGRKCRAVEIAPGYVAVALQRWVDLTGGEPELIQREINDG